MGPTQIKAPYMIGTLFVSTLGLFIQLHISLSLKYTNISAQSQYVNTGS